MHLNTRFLAVSLIALTGCSASIHSHGGGAEHPDHRSAVAAAEEAPAPAPAETAPVAEPAPEAPQPEAEGVFARQLPSGVKIQGNPDGVESKLIAFIESDKPVDKTTWFTFDRLLFDTGKATLNMERSRDQLANIAAILAAYPNVKLKLGGYTDNVGNADSNLKLSQRRAENVMAAIVELGVEKSRLTAEGFGQQHPVCKANDTAECRAQNRRIDVRVTQK